jgi:3-oxoacyl-[acyl-carrier protein] reductase
MDLAMSGRRALITGSSGGIGSAIARQLAAEGAAVVVHGRDAAAAGDIQDQIRDGGGRAEVVLGELGDAEAVTRIAEQAVTAFGGIDILVNSAGASDSALPWFEATPDLWERRYRLSTIYPVRLIQALAPAMRTAGWGRVVNLGSLVGSKPGAFHPEYSAAKAALNNVTAGLANELAGSGVTINTVEPGVIMTPNTLAVVTEHARAFGITETGAEFECRVSSDLYPNLVGRLGTVDDIAAAVCFLASERAGFINGTLLRVDGGQFARF